MISACSRTKRGRRREKYTKGFLPLPHTIITQPKSSLGGREFILDYLLAKIRTKAGDNFILYWWYGHELKTYFDKFRNWKKCVINLMKWIYYLRYVMTKRSRENDVRKHVYRCRDKVSVERCKKWEHAKFMPPLDRTNLTVIKQIAQHQYH